MLFSPRHLVRRHCPLCTVKRLLRKLLDVGLACRIVHDGIVVWALRLCGLEALEQRLCEAEAVIVGGVQALSYNLVDGMVFACFFMCKKCMFHAECIRKTENRHIHQYETAGLKARSWFARLRNRLTSGILSGGGIGSAIAVCARLSAVLDAQIAKRRERKVQR